MNKATSLDFDAIKIGDVFQFTKTFSRDEVITFSRLTGDFNPLHVDTEFGKKSLFKKNVVHGMLASSLFSTIVGMHCPGKKSLYLSQSLNFKSPIFYDDVLVVKGTGSHKSKIIKLVSLKTEILKDGKVVISGEAKVKVLEDTE